MQHISKSGRKGTEPSRSKILMVSVGIVLFVIGFILTVAAIPQTKTSAANGTDRSAALDDSRAASSHEFYLLSGMFVSLTGVVLATVGPAVGFVKKTSKQ